MIRMYIAGRRGAGKSALAEMLEKRGAVVVKITSPIYEIAKKYFGMSQKDRLLLQRVGDAFRSVDPVWLARYAAARAEALAVSTGARVAVIEGVRTREEAEWLADRGWVGILVTAPEEARLARRPGEPAEADAHRTEYEVDSVPALYVIRNDGSLAALEAAAEAVLE